MRERTRRRPLKGREERGQARRTKYRDLDVLDGDLAVLGWRSRENNGDRVEMQGLLLGAKGNWKGFKQKNICV